MTAEFTASGPESAERIAVERVPVIEPGDTRVLVTNDDGVESPGILHLADALAELFDVTIAAPSHDWSGAGTAIGHFDLTLGIAMSPADIGGHRAYAVDGPPGLAVMAAALGAYGEPYPLVVSGINAGINTGHSVIHSGTVGAALTAKTFGAHGIAVSLQPGTGAERWQWETAAVVAVEVAKWLTSIRRPPTAVNVNVPALPIDQVRGVRAAKLDRFGYFRVAIANESDRKLDFEVFSDADRVAVPGTDSSLVRDGYVTITRLSGLTADTNWDDDELSGVWTQLTESIDAGGHRR